MVCRGLVVTAAPLGRQPINQKETQIGDRIWVLTPLKRDDERVSMCALTWLNSVLLSDACFVCCASLLLCLAFVAL